MKNLVYLAGPITGLSYGGCTDWRDAVSDQLNSDKVECLTPMRGKNFLLNEKAITAGLEAEYDKYKNVIVTGKGITRRDMFDTLRSTCLFVNMLGAKRVSIGTCMELAWAYQNQIPTIVVMEPGNLHEHVMLVEACTYVVGTIAEGVDLTRFLLNEQR